MQLNQLVKPTWISIYRIYISIIIIYEKVDMHTRQMMLTLLQTSVIRLRAKVMSLPTVGYWFIITVGVFLLLKGI